MKRDSSLNRRSFLFGGSLLVGTALLAACSQASAPAATTAPASSSAPTTAPVATTAAAPTTAAATAPTTVGTAATSIPAPAAQAASATTGGTLGVFSNKVLTPPGAQDKMTQTWVADFTKANPGWKIDWNHYNSPAEETNQLETSVASGSGPDIFQFGTTVLPTAAATGDFVVLSDAEWKEIGGKDKFFPSLLTMAGLTPSELIGVPQEGGGYAVCYNTELLAKADAKPPITWTDFVDVAKKMTNPDQGIWGTVMDPADPYDPWHILWPMTRQLGGGFVSEDLTKATMDSEPVYTANRFWFDWMTKYKIVDIANATFKNADALNAFGSGHIGLLPMQNQSVIRSLDKSSVAGKYAFTPMPTIPYGMSSRPPNGKPVQAFVAGQYLTIAKYTKVKQTCLEFLKFLTDTPQQMLLFNTLGELPSTLDAFKQPQLQTPLWQTFLGAEKASYPTPKTGAWGPIETVIGGYTSKIAASIATNSYQSGDLKKALAAAQVQVQKLLDAEQAKKKGA